MFLGDALLRSSKLPCPRMMNAPELFVLGDSETLVESAFNAIPVSKLRRAPRLVQDRKVGSHPGKYAKRHNDDPFL